MDQEQKIFYEEFDLHTEQPIQRVIFSVENDTDHAYFLWNYTEHYISLCENYPNLSHSDVFYVEIKEYKSNITGGASFITWQLLDSDFDGVVDEWRRDFSIVLENKNIVFPVYPDDFIVENWENPPKEVAQKRFDEEIKYWDKIKGHEQWEIKIQSPDE